MSSSSLGKMCSSALEKPAQSFLPSSEAFLRNDSTAYIATQTKNRQRHPNGLHGLDVALPEEHFGVGDQQKCSKSDRRNKPAKHYMVVWRW